jgi:BirA family biotin operon repressor/biotin-[acetyl-CoA-carboxylase] ligase
MAPMTRFATAVAELSLVPHQAWTIHVAKEIGSTNSAAARLPAWHAVRARVQTDGRGRLGRTWVSDEGGLWLSAVVPCPGERAEWAILPLAAGWAIMVALQELGVSSLRLRWPNDIMCGTRKLAGLLVERFTPTTAVVGIGLNVLNFPEVAEPALGGITTRLADLLPDPGTFESLTQLLLQSIERAHALIRDGDFAIIARDLNRHWADSRRVAVTLTTRGDTFIANFNGIDDYGRIQLSTQLNGPHAYDASQIALLREIA